MTDPLVAALLGLIQGLTEFLPVSSTAHLALAEHFFGLDPDRFGLTFDVALHLGTLLAVFVYFIRTWMDLLRGLLRGRWHVPAMLAVGTVPGAVAGVLLESRIERDFRGPLVIAAMLTFGSLLFLVAEGGWARARRRRRDAPGFGWADAIFMGTAQAVALLPGISRSGITISAGLVRGLEREDATRFSFLLATPIIAGAGAKTLLDLRKAAALFERADLLAIGFAVSFAVGLLTVAFLMRFLREHTLAWFVPYRLALAAAIAVVVEGVAL